MNITVEAYADTLSCVGRLGPDTAAMQTMCNVGVDQPLGKVQPAWRSRIANLRLRKAGQPTGLTEYSTGPGADVAEKADDTETGVQPAAVSDSSHAVFDGSCSPRD